MRIARLHEVEDQTVCKNGGQASERSLVGTAASKVASILTPLEKLK